MPVSEFHAASLRFARASKAGVPPEEREAARRARDEARDRAPKLKLERAIRAALASAPPLDVADREELASILAPWVG